MHSLHKMLIVSILVTASLTLFAGPTPETLKSMASVAQLEAAIDRHAESLKELLSDEKRFADKLTRDHIRSKAASISCVAQAILDHPDVKSTKSRAALVREASQKLVEAETWEQTRTRLQEIETAAAGQPLEYTAEDKEDWTELASMDILMEELTNLQADLRRTVRRSRDPESDSLDATSASLLALVTKENLDYTFDDEDEAAWKKMAQQMADEYRNMASAMRAKETKAAREHHANAAKVCAACHDKFRD